jgi:histidinol dehydrogenase
MKNLHIKKASWSLNASSNMVESFLHRPAIDASAEQVARAILEDIRKEGDRAVVRHARERDTPGLKASTLRISREELEAARAEVDADFLEQAAEADRRIFAFARAGRPEDWEMAGSPGGRLGEQFRPLDRVGVYIPGGTAPLASTSLMTATIARAAGVKEIVAVTPADREGRVNPYVLAALEIAGATEIYRVGGVPAIGALAYGTNTIAKVQKIVGPGNAYVTAAKKLVYGEVSLDSVAGPSEVAILADETASVVHVAADLLAQAEHGTGLEKALLVTPCQALIDQLEAELLKQAAALSRVERLMPILKEGVLAVSVPNLEEGMELINRFAAEHLELLVAAPRTWVKKVRAAGAIFLGHYTPESAGDFATGPSHVLPTGGAAAMFSGLTVHDFMRRSSVIQLTRRELQEVMPVIEAFGKVEGLDGHVNAARVRFGKS